MATYKVIQDIEAEDKLIGPLSLRQFIYAAICIGCGFLCFWLSSKGGWYLGIVFIPPALLFGFLAVPWKGDQPTEVWALAKINFMMKPRNRIWNQSGVKELVTITAPKTIERVYTNGLSQTEVRSRLKALADTIDSRGWVIKNISAASYSQPGFLAQQSTDRLLEVDAMPQDVPAFTTQASDDMLDMQNNPVAQKFGNMIAASEKAHRDQIVARMNAPEQPMPVAPPVPMTPAPIAPPTTQPMQPAGNDYWFLNQPAQGGTTLPQDTVTFNTQVVAPGTTPDALPITAAAPTPAEEEFIKHLKAQPVFSPNMHGHLHVVQPLSAQQAQAQADNAQAMQQAAQPAQQAVAQPGVPLQQVTPSAPAPAPQAPPQVAAAAATEQVTPAQDTAILDLARNDDLNVATLAREAQKRKELQDEVVISLH
jgi:hypothetical protein